MSKEKINREYIKDENILELAFDSHAHLDRAEDVDSLINKLPENGVCAVINMANNVQSGLRAREISRKYKNIYFMLGLHPDDLDKYNDEYEAVLTELSNEPNMVGVGEIGLDYHGENVDREKQIKYFTKQIILADKLNKPISLHIRDAHDDALAVLKENAEYLNHGGVIHCCSADLDFCREYIKLGFYISIAGNFTFKKGTAETELERAVKNIPLDRILVETDTPFLCPTPYRGNVNEPKYVVVTARAVADCLNMDANEFIKQTRENTFEFIKNSQ